MGWLFNRKKKADEPVHVSVWKDDFSDCTTKDYLPAYSVCLNDNNTHCRFVAMYAGMTLCGNPEHKKFIPEGSEPFDPHKGQFKD
jgi:hypothetical protein